MIRPGVYRLSRSSRPACTRIVFRIRTEQWFTGCGAHVGARVMVVPIRVVECGLCPLIHHNIIRLGRQSLLPISIGFGFGVGFYVLTRTAGNNLALLPAEFCPQALKKAIIGNTAISKTFFTLIIIKLWNLFIPLFSFLTRMPYTTEYKTF